MNNELALLSAVLMNPEELDEITLSAEAFNEPKHSRIWQTIIGLKAEGSPINIVSVGEKLSPLREYVYHLTDQFFPAGSAGYFASQVNDAFVKRELVALMQMLATKQDQPAETLIDEARSKLNKLTSGESSLRSLAEVYAETVDSLKNPPAMIPCDFPQLREKIDGWRNGAMYVVAARPGVGKTIFALETAYQMATHGAVLYFSMEMGDSELVKRLTASVTSVLASAITTSKLNRDDWERLEVKRNSFNRELYIDDKPSINVNYIRSQFKKLARQTEVKGIVIDYLGLMSDTERAKNRYEKVTNISNALKQLARELDVPIVALHQLNREVEGRSTPKPNLADLRDSGAIEQDADVVMLLHRDLNERGLMDSILHVGIAKNRHGAQGACQFQLHPEYVRMAHG
jgi:replicative DNA helicase